MTPLEKKAFNFIVISGIVKGSLGGLLWGEAAIRWEGNFWIARDVLVLKDEEAVGFVKVVGSVPLFFLGVVGNTFFTGGWEKDEDYSSQRTWSRP